MKLSLIPFLFAALVGWIGWCSYRAERRGVLDARGRKSVWAVLFLLVLWGVLSGVLAARGTYLSAGFLRSWPGFWLPLVPFAIVGAALAFSEPFCRGLLATFDATPPSWLVWVHALRIGALGTLVKTLQGEFPLHFELGVGLPDLVFGLSSLWVARLVRIGAITWRRLAVWHGVGFAAVAIPALLLLQLGLPSSLQVFYGPPASEALLVYPMALAPTVVVPLFLMLNFGTAFGLYRRKPEL